MNKYQPVQPITVNSDEFPALARLAMRVSLLATQGTDNLQAALERQDHVAMPRELLDIAISISIGESHE